MLKFATVKYQEMMNALSELPVECKNQLQLAERSYGTIKAFIEQLNDYIIGYTFSSKDEEIEFFKETKPQFLRELIYHKEVFYIEAKKPKSSVELLRQYYTYELDGIKIYFDRNKDFYNYFQIGKRNLDELYYLRNTANDYNYFENDWEIDRRCNTIYSNKLAKLLALEEVYEYLQTSLYKLDHPKSSENKTHKFEHLWTGSKTELLELIYLIFVSGSVNHGKAKLSHLVADAQIFFNIDLGNYSRTFDKMSIRIKNQTPFIDGGKRDLINYMNRDRFTH